MPYFSRLMPDLLVSKIVGHVVSCFNGRGELPIWSAILLACVPGVVLVFIHAKDRQNAGALALAMLFSIMNDAKDKIIISFCEHCLPCCKKPSARENSRSLLDSSDTSKFTIKDLIDGNSSWELAKRNNDMSTYCSMHTALARLIFMHVMQPAFFFVTLYCVYERMDFWADWIRYAVVTVAFREALYVVSTALALCINPAFLLVDIGASLRNIKVTTPLRDRVKTKECTVLCSNDGDLTSYSEISLAFTYVLASDKYCVLAAFRDKPCLADFMTSYMMFVLDSFCIIFLSGGAVQYYQIGLDSCDSDWFCIHPRPSDRGWTENPPLALVLATPVVVVQYAVLVLVAAKPSLGKFEGYMWVGYLLIGANNVVIFPGLVALGMLLWYAGHATLVKWILKCLLPFSIWVCLREGCCKKRERDDNSDALT